MAQIVSLSSASNKTLTVALQINGGSITLRLAIGFNAMAGYWVMNIADSGGAPLVNSIPLLTGAYPAANILAPYQYMFIGSAYVLNASGTTMYDYPGQNDLGTDFILLWDNQANYYYAGALGNPLLPYPGYAGNAGPAGPQGPQGIQGVPGPPGLTGIPDGINPIGTSGTLTPDMTMGWTQVTGTGGAGAGPLTGTANVVQPVSPENTGTFLVRLIQPSTGGGFNVTFSSWYRGLSTFAIDTTIKTQSCLLFQVAADGSYAELLLPPITGWPIT